MEWKYIMSMFAILVLVLGVLPMTLAERGSGRGNSDSRDSFDDAFDSSDDDSDDDSFDDSDGRSDDSSDEDSDDDSDSTETEIEIEREGPQGNYKLRLKMAENARERYQEVRERFEERKGKVEEIRTQFAACKDDKTAACRRIKVQAQENVPRFLVNSADLILNALERVRDKVAASDDLSQEQKTDLLAQIDAEIAAVQGAQANATNLTNASFRDMKGVAKQMREEWQESRKVLKQGLGHTINAKLGNIVNRAEQLSEKIHATRDRLAAQGADVSALDAKIATYDAQLANATALWQDAVDLYANATAGNVDEIAQQAHEKVRAATAILKDVRESLRGIVAEIRALNNGGIDIDDDGNTTGNFTGNYTGNFTGNTTGNYTGNYTGNVTGNGTGNVTG